jgi:hypothetical protein
MNLIEMTSEQSRVFIDTAQLHESFMDAFVKSRAYRGGMHWKKAKGREYLFRTRDRYGYGNSLGPRSSETDTIYSEFHKNKQKTMDRLGTIRKKLKNQARFCKAAKIQRVPRMVTAIVRLLEQHKLLGRNIMVIGTHALYAYEVAAGIFFEPQLLATRDMDILWDVRARLNLYTLDEVDVRGLIGILKKADKSFELMGKKSFRAVNRDGYMVDLVKPEPKSLLIKEIRKLGDEGDLVAAEIRNLQWLVASPKFTNVVIGDDGYPAAMTVPDPRAFALHKLWLSKRADRDPAKRHRDHDQALAVCRLILQYLPNYKFDPMELRMFPKEVVTESLSKIKTAGLPVGFDGS